MSQFTDNLFTEYLADENLWRVTKGFRFYKGEYGSDEWTQVPRGFLTDLTSVPGLVRWAVPKMGNELQASVVHDCLYRDGYYFKRIEGPDGWVVRVKFVTRKEADDLYLEAMVALGVSKWRRTTLREGLRVGGGVAWANHRANDLTSLRRQRKRAGY